MFEFNETGFDCPGSYPEQLSELSSTSDLILNVLEENSESFVAAAGVCDQSAVDNRPTTGRMYLNLKYIDSHLTKKLEIVFNSILHELFHALGFSADMVSEFVDENGRALEKVVFFVESVLN